MDAFHWPEGGFNVYWVFSFFLANYMKFWSKVQASRPHDNYDQPSFYRQEEARTIPFKIQVCFRIFTLNSTGLGQQLRLMFI